MLNDKSPKALREESGRCALKAGKIRMAAAGEGRIMNAAELSEVERLNIEGTGLLAQANAIEEKDSQAVYAATGIKGGAVRPTQADHPTGNGDLPNGNTSTAGRWVDEAGKSIRVYAKGERLSTGKYGANAAGEFIAGAISAKRRSRCSPEIRAALSESSNSGGGYLVPDELSATIIDKARAKAVCLRAGALTVPMESETLRIARVKTDPTMQLKGEGDTFSGSDPVFDAVNLTSQTIGCIVKSSRELAEDSPNFVEEIENVLSNALAVQLDAFCLTGTDSQQPEGLLVKPGVGENASTGTISWEAFLDAIKSVENANGSPNAYVVSPLTKNKLSKLVSGDGTNSAKLWLPAPDDVKALERFVTTNCPDTAAFVGDFTKCVFGIRQQPLLEISNNAGTAFEAHQVWVKITWRGDFGFLHEDHFYRLLGIS